MNDDFELPSIEEPAQTEEATETPSGGLSSVDGGREQDEAPEATSSPSPDPAALAKELQETRAKLAKIEQDRGYQQYQAEEAKRVADAQRAEQERYRRYEQQRQQDLDETRLVVAQAERLKKEGYEDAATDLLLRFGARKTEERLAAALPGVIEEQVQRALDKIMVPYQASTAFRNDPRTANIRDMEDVAMALIASGKCRTEEEAIARCEAIKSGERAAKARAAKAQALQKGQMESVDSGSAGTSTGLWTDEAMDNYVNSILGIGKQRAR